MVARLAEQLHVDAGALAGYGEREQTRTDHLRLVLQYAGWRVPRSLEVKELDEFLLEHDSPSLLFRPACEHLRASQVVRPGVVTLSERVAAARAKAERETYDRLAHLLADARCSELDGLLVVTDAEIGMAQLRWLNTGPVEASAAAVKTEVAKLLFLRGLDAHTLDLPVLPAERRRFLAAVGRRSSMAKLPRREPYRRYPIVLTVLAQSAVDVLDEVVQLFDQAVSAREESGTNRGTYPARNSVPDAGLSDVLTPRRQGVFLRLYSSTAGASRTASLAFCSPESGGAKWASSRRYSSRRCLYLSSRCCPASVISRLAIRSPAPGRSRPAGSSTKKQTRIPGSRCTSRRTGAARHSAAVQAARERRHPRGIPSPAPLGDPPWYRLRAGTGLADSSAASRYSQKPFSSIFPVTEVTGAKNVAGSVA